METDIAYFVTYACPGCGLELEVEPTGWRGWWKCPKCGTPALPPEAFLGHPSVRRRVRDAAGDEILVIEDEALAPTRRRPPAQDPAALIPPPPSPMLSALRLIFGTGLIISLLLVLIAFLDDNSRILGIAGSVALICFLLLLRVPSRRRRKDSMG
ncbi:MAG: hypothetical protein ACYC61_14690 [Isosphaeraceae bacterium]